MTEGTPQVGSTLAGKWYLEKLLGVGGMGTVFLARDAGGQRAALKVLHRDLNDIPEVKKRFLREGPINSALAQIPGVVRILESGQTQDGVAYLAMEALEGETLAERLVREGTFPVPAVLAMARRILDVVVAAHAHGVIHRDLKPENLHLGADGRLTILDFGIARVVDAVHKPLGEADTEAAPLAGLPEKTATKTGTIMGTAAYMAPEQATGLVNEIDTRTDLFSIGATMFRLLAGRTVHGVEGNAHELILAATEAPPPLGSVAFGVPPDVCAVVDRALAFLKHHRYPDASTMREDVRALEARRPPPYVRAVAEGRLAAGAPLPVPAPPSSAAVPPSAMPGSVAAHSVPRSAATSVGVGPASAAAPASALPTSSVKPPSSVGPTLVEPSPVRSTIRDAEESDPGPEGRGRLAVIVVAVIAITAGVGIGVGIAVSRCGRSDHDEPRPTQIDAGVPRGDGGRAPAPKRTAP